MTDRTLAEILFDEAKHADDTFDRYVRMYDTAKEAIRAQEVVRSMGVTSGEWRRETELSEESRRLLECGMEDVRAGRVSPVDLGSFAKYTDDDGED